jgi:hypothetical protein
MIKININKIHLLLIPAGIIVVVAVLMVIFVPLNNLILRAVDEKAGYDQQISFAQDMLGRSTQDKDEAFLVSSRDVVKVMDALTLLGKRHNVEVLALKEDGVFSEDASWREVLLEIETTSSFKDLGLFLTAVRTTSAWMIDTGTINVATDEDDPARVRSTMMFKLFVGKDNG